MYLGEGLADEDDGLLKALFIKFKCSGWSLDDDEEGEERWRCHLSSLPRGVGWGGRGSNYLQTFSQLLLTIISTTFLVNDLVKYWVLSPRLGWWDVLAHILITFLASPSGWEVMTPVPTAGAVSTQSSWSFGPTRDQNEIFSTYHFPKDFSTYLTVFIFLFITWYMDWRLSNSENVLFIDLMSCLAFDETKLKTLNTEQLDCLSNKEYN